MNINEYNMGPINDNPFNIYILIYNGELILLKHKFKYLVWILGSEITIIVENKGKNVIIMNWAIALGSLLIDSLENQSILNY